MSYYLSRYIGTYRVKSEYDLDTNDFARNPDGSLDQNNTYIKCANDAKIFHYGKNILECYVPSLQRGRNMLKGLATELGFTLADYGTPCNYNALYQDLENTKVVFDIDESDAEVWWHFQSKNIELMAKYMKPQTSGANISPFSLKNLPKQKYTIPYENMVVYKQIINDANLDNKLVIGKLTNDFITKIVPKKHRLYAKSDMKKEMRKVMLNGKEFIHSIGLWDEFMNFLRKKLLE